MKLVYDGYNHLVRLQEGELLIESLTRLVKEQGIKSAWLSGLGATLWAEFGFYNLKTKDYSWKKFTQPLEIISLQGNIAWETSSAGTDPLLHIHGVFSDKQMNAFGGHVKELAVGGTCEVFLHRWHKDALTRTHDKATGLNLLDL